MSTGVWLVNWNFALRMKTCKKTCKKDSYIYCISRISASCSCSQILDPRAWYSLGDSLWVLRRSTDVLVVTGTTAWSPFSSSSWVSWFGAVLHLAPADPNRPMWIRASIDWNWIRVFYAHELLCTKHEVPGLVWTIQKRVCRIFAGLDSAPLKREATWSETFWGLWEQGIPKSEISFLES